MTTLKGLPSGYNRIYGKTGTPCSMAKTRCPAAWAPFGGRRGLTSTFRAAAAASGLLLATDVADYLVGRGVPFRRAHEIVGALVRKLVAEGRDFESLTMDEWRASSDRFDTDVVGRVTPRISVEAKRTPQSTAPEAVRSALAEVRQWLAHNGTQRFSGSTAAHSLREGDSISCYSETCSVTICAFRSPSPAREVPSGELVQQRQLRQ